MTGEFKGNHGATERWNDTAHERQREEALMLVGCGARMRHATHARVRANATDEHALAAQQVAPWSNYLGDCDRNCNYLLGGLCVRACVFCAYPVVEAVLTMAEGTNVAGYALSHTSVN
jgi:hypothetical protein